MASTQFKNLGIVLSTALAAGLGACGDTAPCSEVQTLDTLRSELGADYLVVRRLEDYESWDTGSVPEQLDGQSSGEACSTATPVDACNDALDEAWPTEAGWKDCGQVGCTYSGLVATRGNEVVLAQTVDELYGLFGVVDSPAKAAFLVNNPHDYRAECSTIKEASDGFEMSAWTVTSDCPWTEERHKVQVSSKGALEVLKVLKVDESSACAGRRPKGLQPVADPNHDPVAGQLAVMARLEAAAVVAFEHMALDLERLGAPPQLVERARQAAGDEVEHARIMGELAAARGASALPVEVCPHQPPGLLDFALLNAVEGCVRETYGVVEAAFRARRAPTADLRAVYALIAADEARHAQLSWDVAAWVEPLLSEADRQHLANARAQAHQALQGQLARSGSSAVTAALGAPDPREACAMAASLERSLAA